MDPSIMKFLEEDEDETMHSGADVEAFTAALNRDIEGDTIESQPSNSESGNITQGSHHTSGPLFAQWQTSSQDESSNSQNPHTLTNLEQQEQPSSDMVPKQDCSSSEIQQQNDISRELNHPVVQQKQSQDNFKEHCTEHIPIQFPQSTGMLVSEANAIQLTPGIQQKKSQNNFQQWNEGQTSLQFPQTSRMQILERNHGPIREPDRNCNPSSELQYSNLQRVNNQLETPAGQVSNLTGRPKQVPFGLLLPVILPQLDKDRTMQLEVLYNRLRKNEVPKNIFVKLMRSIVGDQKLKLAISQLHPDSESDQLQSQMSGPKNTLNVAPSCTQQFGDPHSYAQLHQQGSNSKDLSRVTTSGVKVKTELGYNNTDHSAQTFQEMEHQLDSQGMPLQASQMSSSSLNALNQGIQGLSKQQQQHLHFSQPRFSMYGSGGTSYHSYAGTNANASQASFKTQFHDSQKQVSLHQNMVPTQLGGANKRTSMMIMPKFEKQNSVSDPKRLQGGSFPNSASNTTFQKNLVPRQSITNMEKNNSTLPSIAPVKQEQSEQAFEKQQNLATSQVSSFSSIQVEQCNLIPGTRKDEFLEKQSFLSGSSASTTMAPSTSLPSSMITQMDHNVMINSRSITASLQAGINGKSIPKKLSLGQKKPLETLGSSPPLPSKKQKVSSAFSDQSIEQLIDVTASSGVNLREEEEQLFSGPKDDSRVSEVSRRIVQEEEEKLILQRIPLQKKLAQIMTKCGLKTISNDVERCISYFVEQDRCRYVGMYIWGNKNMIVILYRYIWRRY